MHRKEWRVLNLNYTYELDTKKFLLGPSQNKNATLVHPNIASINILVNPHKFKEKVSPLEHTNDKWFINLSDTEILFNVLKLFQLGNNFSFQST